MSLEVDYLQFSPQGTDSNFRDGKWLIRISQVAREDLEWKKKQALPNFKASASFTALYSLSKWKWKSKSLSCVWLFVTPWTIQSLESSRPEYWSEEPFPFSGNLPNPGIEPRSLTLQADALPAEPQGKTKNTAVGSLSLLHGIFPTQESKQGLLHCRQILYQLSYQESPFPNEFCFKYWIVGCLFGSYNTFP